MRSVGGDEVTYEEERNVLSQREDKIRKIL